MTDVSHALEADSDQLNAVDIMAANRTIRVREVKVTQGDQPVSIYFDGDHGKPWRPSKGMLRILAGAWGTDSAAWIGKHAELKFEPSVMYAGKAVGGIRIAALSDIPEKGMQFTLTINRQKREAYPVPLLVVDDKPYPAERFDAAFDAMVEQMATGTMTLQAVIARCEKTGRLSSEQIARLEDAAPIEVSNEDEGAII